LKTIIVAAYTISFLSAAGYQRTSEDVVGIENPRLSVFVLQRPKKSI
jgi:hypothetical protein